MATAYTYRCRYEVTALCDRGDRKPTRAKCSACGSALSVWTGAWGVFLWTGKGNYPRDAAKGLYASQARAETKRSALGDDHVVRFVYGELAA